MTSVYKILSNVLSRGLSDVLDVTISANENAFVGGRQILYVALVSSEVVENVRWRGRTALILKLDFEKAYDMIIWDLLDKVLARKGLMPR